MSSPAMVTSMQVVVMVRPMEGKSLGLRVGGSWVKEPRIGLERSMVFGPASSEAQQRRPAEDEAGEKPGGIIAKEMRYHAISAGSNRYPSQEAEPVMMLLLLLFL